MTDWRFELADSVTLAPLGELTQARNRSLTLSLNKPGAFGFELPLDDPMALLVDEVKTCILCKRAGTVVWSGPIWTVEESTPNQITIGCVGWLQTLEKRLTRASWGNPLIYNDVDAGFIAQDLVSRANVESDASGAPRFVLNGSTEGTQLRDASYQPHTQILTEITNLTTIESGFDVLVDPVTREMNIYFKTMVDRTNVAFEWGSNLSSAGRSSDSEKLVNRFVANGSNNLSQAAEDLDSQAQYGIIEEVATLSDVTNATILQAFAQAEIALRAFPLRTHTFIPKKETANSPRLFNDFFLGDKVYLRVQKGRLDVPKQAVRLFGITISFDGIGNEQLSSVSTLVEG